MPLIEILCLTGIAALADVEFYPDLTYHDPQPPGVPILEHYLKHHLPVQTAAAIYYLEHQSLLLDMQVIARLIFCVLVRSWLPPVKRPVPDVGNRLSVSSTIAP